MRAKIIIFFVIPIVIILLISGIIVNSSSYSKSFKAKYYYSLGNYKDAYELSSIAYKEDIYNKMAFSIMNQSKISMDFASYIKQGEEFLEKIESLSKNASIDEKDKVRIKIYCEIMLEEYKNLHPLASREENLKRESLELYENFKLIHDELF